jgi:hypothetical protein
MGCLKYLLFGDLHCGSRLGLTPPKAQRRYGRDLTRQLLWNWFHERIRKHAPFDGAILNGDSVDGDGARSGGIGLLTTDRVEQIDIAEEAVSYISAKRWWHTAGTPYHSGCQESWERILSKAIGARYELEAHLDLNGMQLCVRHYIGNTQSPASRFTGLSNAQVKQVLWALRGQQPRANLIVRSHVHRCQEIADPATNFRACTLPGLLGLGSPYSVVKMDTLPVDFGFAVLDVQDASNWGITYEVAPLRIQSASVQRIRG